MNVPDAFWTMTSMVNHGMTKLPMDIRFETLMSNFFYNSSSSKPTDTKYRLLITSHNQPELLFMSLIESDQEPFQSLGHSFPTLLKKLIADSVTGKSQIDLVNESPRVSSLFVRRVEDTQEPLPWFGCRLELAEDVKIREHLASLVVSLRAERDKLIREKNDEHKRRIELERELEVYKNSKPFSRPKDGHERFQDLFNSIASVDNENSNHSNPGSSSVHGEDNVIPLEFDITNDDIFNISNSPDQEKRVESPGTSMIRPRSSTSGPSSEEILRGMATYVLCALCPESSRTAVPDEHIVMDHIVTQHFDDRKTCTGCPVRTEVRDIPSHIKMHMNKIYACKFCGKQSSKRNVLRAHVRTHTGERPFECIFCQRRFTDSSTLRRHKTVHTGEMRAACPICGRIISRKDNVKAHMRNHHGLDNVDEFNLETNTRNEPQDPKVPGPEQVEEVNMKPEIESLFS
uniref:C2H2-type domain-containing protein n=1 Tax=Panagrolaimus sp. JU765 TaxID=591449 RepID=A0AC34QM14_9BILA